MLNLKQLDMSSNIKVKPFHFHSRDQPPGRCLLVLVKVGIHKSFLRSFCLLRAYVVTNEDRTIVNLTKIHYQYDLNYWTRTWALKFQLTKFKTILTQHFKLENQLIKRYAAIKKKAFCCPFIDTVIGYGNIISSENKETKYRYWHSQQRHFPSFLKWIAWSYTLIKPSITNYW